MRKLLFTIIVGLILFNTSVSQTVGIGSSTFTPSSTLEIQSTFAAGHFNGNGFTITNTTTQALDVRSELWFKNATRFTGAIKTVGDGAALARLSFFTNSNTTPTNLLERMFIDDNGRISLGTDATGDRPNTLLDIIGGASAGNTTLFTIRKDDNTANNEIGFKLINSTNVSSDNGFQFVSKLMNTNGRSDLIIRGHDGSTGLIDRLRLYGNGDIGFNGALLHKRLHILL